MHQGGAGHVEGARVTPTPGGRSPGAWLGLQTCTPGPSVPERGACLQTRSPGGGGAARAKGFELLLKRPEALGQSEGPPSEMSLGWGGAARGQRGWRLSPWGWVAGWCC